METTKKATIHTTIFRNRTSRVAALAAPLLMNSLLALAADPSNSVQAADQSGAHGIVAQTVQADWTSRIGSGHANAAPEAGITSVTVPSASPDLSALIGTGHLEVVNTPKAVVSPSSLTSVDAKAHWTSKFGTAHAADSEPVVVRTRVAS